MEPFIVENNLKITDFFHNKSHLKSNTLIT